MRVVSFSFPYAAYVGQFYASNPELRHASFAVQSRALEGDYFPGASDALAAHLVPFGFESTSYALTVPPLQRAWAYENGVDVEGPDWNLRVAWQQVLQDRPDILIVDPYSIPTSWLRELRETCSSIRIVMSRYSSPREDLSRYRHCDVVVSGDRAQVSQLRDLSLNGFLLHHGFDERILEKLEPRRPRDCIFFGGQLHRSEGFHAYRLRVITALLDSGLPLALRVPPADSGSLGPLKQRMRRLLWILHRLLEKRTHLPVKSIPVLGQVSSWSHRPAAPLPKSVRRNLLPPLFGVALYREMRQSRVSLNSHGDVSASDANNLRLWEASGVGSCLLTDAKSNMADLFDVGSEVVVYESPNDCWERAEWLLCNPKKADEIAARGRQRVLREHTLSHRAEELAAILRAALGAEN